MYDICFKQFEKHTLPKWSIVHTIIDKNVHSYKLDNGKFYKCYELQNVPEVQKLEKPVVQSTRQQRAQEKTVNQKFKQSGLDPADIITTKRTPALKDWTKQILT